jgi:nucleotide-binding universal stress UspA family protein
MERQIYLAYDGSINADWVARYAIRMAAALDHRKITLLHILDHPAAAARVEERFAAIATECAATGIDCQGLIHRPGRDVCTSLLQTIPAGDSSYCLCGARIASLGRGFLAGTVSERLLRSARFNVMAIRVVSPGLLGCPATLLFPLAGHPRGFSAAMPFLQMLTTPQSTVHLLRVMLVNPFLHRYISAEVARARLASGRDYLTRAVSWIRQGMAGIPCHLDHHVVLSGDWAGEILLQADRVHASMILLGATERSLPSRFFYGNRLEEILRRTPCDVGIYRRP